MTAPAAAVNLPVVQQHLEESAHLRLMRRHLLRAAAPLHALNRLDTRIAAHMDGLIVAGQHGAALLNAALASPECGIVFAATAHALQTRHAEMLTGLVDLALAQDEAERGFLSGLGWVSANDLQGTVRALLGSKIAAHRAWGLRACAMHRTDPGTILAQAVHDPDAKVQASAWCVAGQLGRRDLADAARQAVRATPHAAPALHDEHATVLIQPTKPGAPLPGMPDSHAAAWALTLWSEGDNDLVRQALLQPCPAQSLPCAAAHRLAVLAAPIAWGRDQVRTLVAAGEGRAAHKRRALALVGWLGDPQAIPWLLQHMADARWSRLAAEAFCLITGADLDRLGLLGEPVPVSDHREDPQNHDVAIDEDDSLPWPDQAKVQAWWQAQASRFAVGQRYFLGEPPGIGHVIHVLKTGGQRQRIMAAEYLCLLKPGSMMLPVAAPAWRQSRWLNAEA